MGKSAGEWRWKRAKKVKLEVDKITVLVHVHV